MKKNNFRFWLGLIIVSGLLWLADGRGYFNYLKRPIIKFSQSLRNKLYQLKVKPEEEQSAETAILEAQVIKLTQENANLRELLGTKLPASWKFIPANILMINQANFIIDNGSKDGAVEGQPAIAIKKDEINNGILIGKVIKVSEWQAEVMTLNNESVKIKVKTGSGALGLVQSVAGKLTLTEVLQKDILNQNELLVSAGQDGWPPGLAVGRVGAMIKNDAAVYQEAEVNLLLEIKALSRVFVIKE